MKESDFLGGGFDGLRFLLGLRVSFLGMGMMKIMKGLIGNGIGYFAQEIWGAENGCMSDIGRNRWNENLYIGYRNGQGQHGVHTLSEGVKSVYRAKDVPIPSPELTNVSGALSS